MNKRKHSIRYLVLSLTNDCNLSCSYCYQGDTTSKQSMPFQTACDALDHAALSEKPFHVQLTGGEPLLEPSLIKSICTTIRNKNMNASISIQTNGTLITPWFADICKRFNIEPSISVDGPPEIHNHLRGSFSEILKGIHILEAHTIPYRITTVLCHENAPFLSKLVLMLAGFSHIQGFGIDILVQKGRASKSTSCTLPSPQDIKTHISHMLTTLGKVNSRRNKPLQFRELDYIIKLLSQKKSLPFCHAAIGQCLAVHPSSKVYPCSQTAGEPFFEAGTVTNIKWKKLHLNPPSKDSRLCHKCPLKEMCPGNCPSRLLYNREHNLLSCVMYQTIFKHIID